MATLTIAELFNAKAAEIKAHFPGVELHFVGKDVPEQPELQVYVSDKKNLKAVKEFCRAADAAALLKGAEPLNVSVRPSSEKKVTNGQATILARRREEFSKRVKEIRNAVRR